jgi:hypothetical protein
MSLMDSKGTLSSAAKELFARWENVKSIWSDAQSQAYEETYLVQIERDIRSAFGALDSMSEVISRIETDCE